MNGWILRMYKVLHAHTYSHVRINNNKKSKFRRIYTLKMQYQLSIDIDFVYLAHIKCSFVWIIFARKNKLHLFVFDSVCAKIIWNSFIFFWIAMSFGRSIIKFRLKSRLLIIINRHCRSCYPPLNSLSLFLIYFEVFSLSRIRI